MTISITITGPVILFAGFGGSMTLTEALDNMTAKVTAAETVEAGAKQLILDIATQLRANANAPDAINALAARLEASDTSLAAAVAANTAAAPAPAPVTDPTANQV